MSTKKWEKANLGEICQIICGATPSTTVPEYWLDEIKWVTAKDVSESTGYKIYDTERKISKMGFEKCSTKMIPSESTILIARGATMGASCMLGEDMAINQTCYALVPDKEKINPHFLFYTIKQLDSYFQQIAHGAIFNTVIGSGLRGTEIYLPPLPTQRRIAEILSALDDKIELNRQTNATLEAIAQAIFKEWFVNFNFPGATGEMVESELGMIPEGWKVGRLGEIVEFAYGKALKSENRAVGKYPVIGSNGVVGFHNSYLVEGPGIVIGRKGTIGKVNWIHNNFFPIDTTFYIKNLLGIKDLFYNYFLLKMQDFKKIGSDSAVPGLNRNQAYDNLIIIPSVKIMELFNNKIGAFFEIIYNNDQESTTIANLRDSLLPKFLNGEIEV